MNYFRGFMFLVYSMFNNFIINLIYLYETSFQSEILIDRWNIEDYTIITFFWRMFLL